MVNARLPIDTDGCEQLAKPLRLQGGHIAQQSGEPALVSQTHFVKQSAANWCQSGKNHPPIIRMRPAIRPTLALQDIDIQRRSPARDRQAARELGRRETDRLRFTEFQQRPESAGGQLQIGQHISRGAINGARGANQLQKRAKSGRVFGVPRPSAFARGGIGHEPAGMNRLPAIMLVPRAHDGV
jgi:hypothetical protein